MLPSVPPSPVAAQRTYAGSGGGVMDEQPDILSFEPRRQWKAPGRLAVFLAGLLVAGLAAGGYLAVAVTHRDSTIDQLRTALRQARQTVPARSAARSAAAVS